MNYYLSALIPKIVGLSAVLGILRLIVPNSFTSLSHPVLEIIMLVSVITSAAMNFKSIDFDECVKVSYDFSSKFENLEASYIEGELKMRVKDKLLSEGIIPSDIRIDITIEEKAEVKGCFVKLYENQRELFMRKKEELEKEAGFPFYPEVEENK